MADLHTSDLARAAGVHPNTVRRYEQRGWLPPAERAPNGYRLFGQAHLDCLRLARMVNAIYASKAIRFSALEIIPAAIAGDWNGALRHAQAHLALVQAERAEADKAVVLLEEWAAGSAADPAAPQLRIGQAAKLIGVSIDVLRNWDRNGLIRTPRQANNRYRAYGPAEISRLWVIRMLVRAGYSQMAILRMALQLDRGKSDLRGALLTSPPDEDLYTASDRWLSTLAEQEQAAQRIIELIEDVIQRRAASQTLP